MAIAPEELRLLGGQINVVTKVGDTVRRTINAHRTDQHSLLRHLEAVGFEAAPRFLGIDDAGREILSYVPGEVHVDDWAMSDDQLAAAARLLRRFHDATVGFEIVVHADAEVMCHNDWTPANAVFRDNLPFALIDFDTARPGSRLWDVSFSAWTWLELGEANYSADEQVRRLYHFCTAYDYAAVTAKEVAAWLPARQASVAQWAEKHGKSAGAEWAHKAVMWTSENITERLHPSGLPSTVRAPSEP